MALVDSVNRREEIGGQACAPPVGE